MGDLLSPPALGVLYLALMAEENKKTLVDPGLLAARRDRAQDLGFSGHGDFLHREVASILVDRLAEVNRPFQNAVLIGSAGGVHADALRMALPGVKLRQIDVSLARATDACAEKVPDYQILPLAVESQDLIISALELHWQDDPVGQLIQMRRALRPDGLVLAALFGGETLYELRTVLAEAEIEISGGLSPRVAPMAELRDLGGLLQRAGFAMPVADSDRFIVSYTDPVALMHDLRRMGETNIMTDRRRMPLRREILVRCAELYAERFPADDGRIQATFEVMFLTGWAPAPDQPKPLRPGSANARLADALGSTERPAGDVARPAPKRAHRADPSG
ncbi:MAG: methyltransferase domain-containing protein [Pseudomonadota bacterium]